MFNLFVIKRVVLLKIFNLKYFLRINYSYQSKKKKKKRCILARLENAWADKASKSER